MEITQKLNHNLQGNQPFPWDDPKEQIKLGGMSTNNDNEKTKLLTAQGKT